MNTNTNPAAASPSDSRDNPCFATDASIATLNVMADDTHSYELPYAQFLYAEKISNPALEQAPDAPPEKMVIRFVQAEVVLLGSGLKAIERGLQRYELKFVKTADQRYAATLKTHSTAVAVTLTKETP